ncbi:hypothetical protein QWM81_25685 [Streptomyces ficellus]|uniref:CGNR zinc finger domain-containing protein n=1 Tax=Streptomyces ficellus TaxID=1977088 RepID=A0ABT7ZCZ0_9ACTN|nr:hypothetical protein [Streptomyces ficellus]MDN3297373.1 hypothetical protein [Streptomyces ficellus]
MHPQDPTPAVPDVHDLRNVHDVTTAERGSFCVARCACGWAGPARRSRDRARTDAAAHITAPPPDGD